MKAWATRGNLDTALSEAFMGLGATEEFEPSPMDVEKADDEIAQLQRVEQALKLNETKLRLQLDFITVMAANSNEGICLVDREGNVIFMNPVAESMLGWSSEELRNKPFHETIHYKHPDGTFFPPEQCSSLQGFLQGQALLNQEDTLITKSGSYLPVNWTSAPVITDGIVVGGVLTFHDMRDPKEKDRLLRLHHLQQDALVELTRSVMRADTTCNLLLNALTIMARTLELPYTVACRYLPEKNALRYICGSGWQQEGQQTGMIHCTEEIPISYSLLTDQPQIIENVPEDPRFENMNLLHRHHIQTGVTMAIRGQVHPFGIIGLFSETVRHFSRSEIQFVNAASHIIAIALEQKRIYHHRESYIKQLWESNKALEDFAFISAYQFQGPLEKIKTYAGYLRKEADGKLEPESIQYLDRLEVLSDRLSTLVYNLLLLGRIARERTTFQPVKLSEVVERALQTLEDTITAKNARIETGILPKVEGDPSQLEQLVFNLVENALKFSREGVPPVIKIYANSMIDPNYCELVVEDNGIGFRPDQAERIFGMFERLHSKDRYPGTGIGLGICRRIAEHHGGSIHASSTPGKGSAFSVKLPLKHREVGDKEFDDTPESYIPGFSTW